MHFYGKDEAKVELQVAVIRAAIEQGPKDPRPLQRLPLSLVYRDSALFYALLDADYKWGIADGA